MSASSDNTIQRELALPQPPEQVWKAITDPDHLAAWLHPNDFEPRPGHRFTFRVPAKPEMNFDGLTVHCEVLVLEPPHHLVFSWSAGGPVEDTRVSFRLEPDGSGTRLFFEHSGFNLTHPFGGPAFKGASYGWAAMLEALSGVLGRMEKAVRNTRVLSATPGEVFDAFRDPEKLARWWGPDGFTNTFETFEFTPGGRWDFTMHAPNGTDYRNENFFREITPDSRIIIEHILKPWFILTVTLVPADGQTRLVWFQEFDSPEMAATMRPLAATANEQVLNRLEAVLAGRNP